VTAWCTECGEEYAPVEYNPAPLDPFTPRFCSDEHEQAWIDREEFTAIYWSAGDPAPVFGP